LKRIALTVLAIFFIFASAFDAKALIAIDAGHGGEDGGASTEGGVTEAEINLDIALKMEQVFALYGVETVMTRRTPESLSTEGKTIRARKRSDINNRIKLIQSADPELLISIHQNKFSQPQYYGAQVFFSANDPVGAELAVFVQENLRLSIDPSNNRKAAVIPNSVLLMKSIKTPAILVECGFLSNPKDAENLCDPEYRLDVAACIAATVINNL
jgi:N-acetylmuramoyl-L-alanine amidase